MIGEMSVLKCFSISLIAYVIAFSISGMLGEGVKGVGLLFGLAFIYKLFKKIFLLIKKALINNRQ